MSEEQLSRTVCVSNNREVLIASDVFIDEDENTIIEAENHNPNFL